MGLVEAQDPMTFRTGVRDRLGSPGERVGLRKIVARVPVSYPSLLLADPHPALDCKSVAGISTLPHILHYSSFCLQRKMLTEEPTVASCARIHDH